MGCTKTMLPVPTSFAVNTAFLRKDSHTTARAPFTNPRCLSKFLLRRMTMPGRATIRRSDFVVGSQKYPSCKSLSVTPTWVSAALQSTLVGGVSWRGWTVVELATLAHIRLAT